MKRITQWMDKQDAATQLAIIVIIIFAMIAIFLFMVCSVTPADPGSIK